MGTALTYIDSDNGRTADTAGQPGAPVNVELILEGSSPVHPINAGSIAVNPFHQH